MNSRHLLFFLLLFFLFSSCLNLLGNDSQVMLEPDLSYLRTAFNKEKISLLDSDNNSTWLLHEDGDYDRDYKWSPSGKTISFIMGDLSLRSLKIYDFEEKSFTTLVEYPGDCGVHSWSPDGSKIAFTTYSDSNLPTLYTMNADGSGKVLVKEKWHFSRHLLWTHDLNNLIYVGWDDSLFTMKLDDPENIILLNEGYEYRDLSLSSDGDLVLFQDGFEIYICNSDGTELQKISDSGRYPCFSPDGMRISFIESVTLSGNNKQKASAGYSSITLMNRDGSDKHRILDAASNLKSPVWSGDGNELYFYYEGAEITGDNAYTGKSYAFHIYSMRPDGTELTLLRSETDFKIKNLLPRPGG